MNTTTTTTTTANTTPAGKLADNAKLPDWHEDPCPVHGGKIKKVYGFGRSGYVPDAEVYVFAGCRCAVCWQSNPAGGDDYAPRYFTSYDKAAGLARLVKAIYQDKYGH